MDCDCDICSEKSWWDRLENEPGLYLTIWSLGTVLTVSLVALYLLTSANGG